LKREIPVRVQWSAFPLHPEIPQAGRSLEELFAGRPVNIAEMMLKLKRIAKSEALPFGDRTMTYNSRLAQELGKWAEAGGRGDAFHHAVFRAYFAEGLNIADKTVLMDVAASVGLEREEAGKMVNDRPYKSAVDDDWRRAYDLGITAVPTFLADGRRLVGAQAYETLKRFVEGSGPNIS
jgi:predicted DsbA family dithiol-disulfide isomerase